MSSSMPLGKVLAAVDGSIATRPVLETAVRIGELLGAPVEAVHVANGGDRAAAAITGWAGVEQRILTGPVAATLVDACAAPDVLLAVVGAQGSPFNREPVGHVTRELMSRTSRPLLVVPLDTTEGSRPVRRILVALEDGKAAPVIQGFELIDRLHDGVELVAVHVFGEATVPMFLDHAEAIDMLTHAILERGHLDGRVRTVLRTGVAGPAIVEVAVTEHADVLVLNWDQDFSNGHAAVIREALTRGVVPVLLLSRRGVAPVEGGIDVTQQLVDLADVERHDASAMRR